jgi:hypothetical protein
MLVNNDDTISAQELINQAKRSYGTIQQGYAVQKLGTRGYEAMAKTIDSQSTDTGEALSQFDTVALA